jgi:hypothetical protein
MDLSDARRSGQDGSSTAECSPAHEKRNGELARRREAVGQAAHHDDEEGEVT